jgi:opacity protein-like surface antigen
MGAFAPTQSYLYGFGTGFDGELGLGYRFVRNVAVEGAVGYFRSKQIQDPVVVWGPGNELLTVVPVTGTVRVILPLGRAEISVLAGLGLYFARLDEDVIYLPSYHVTSTDTTLGAHVGAGFSVQLTPPVSLGADVRYVIASPKFPKISDATMHIEGLRLDAVLAYRF